MGFQHKRRKQLNYMELANDIPSIGLKGRNFLDLLNNNYYSIKPTYIKDNVWLKIFGHLKSLCVKATIAITNYTPIEEY